MAAPADAILFCSLEVKSVCIVYDKWFKNGLNGLMINGLRMSVGKRVILISVIHVWVKLNIQHPIFMS